VRTDTHQEGSVNLPANELGIPEPHPRVGSHEHIDLVRRELDSTEVEVSQRLDRIGRKSISESLVCEQRVDDDADRTQ
jgi:hypothetical protein